MNTSSHTSKILLRNEYSLERKIPLLSNIGQGVFLDANRRIYDTAGFKFFKKTIRLYIRLNN